MPKAVESLLTSIGLSAEDTAAVLAIAEDATFDAKPYADKVKAGYTTQLQNDPAFFNDLTIEKLPIEVKKKVESAQYGRAANIVRQKFLKGLGMTEADYADLPEDKQKELESFIPAIIEKYTKTKSDNPKLQEELIAARKELEKLQALPEELKTKYEGETNQKIASVIFNANLISELSAIPGLKIPASDLAKTALEAILSEYGFEKTGDFSVELRQKADPRMKVLNGSKEVTLKDALVALAEKRGWVEKETKQDDKKNGKSKIDITPSGDGLVAAPHVAAKLAAKIKAEAEGK